MNQITYESSIKSPAIKSADKSIAVTYQDLVSIREGDPIYLEGKQRQRIFILDEGQVRIGKFLPFVLNLVYSAPPLNTRGAICMSMATTADFDRCVVGNWRSIWTHSQLKGEKK